MNRPQNGAHYEFLVNLNCFPIVDLISCQNISFEISTNGTIVYYETSTWSSHIKRRTLFLRNDRLNTFFWLWLVIFTCLDTGFDKLEKIEVNCGEHETK